MKDRLKTNEEFKEWITIFIIFLVFISIINGIFNFTAYQKKIKQGYLIREFPDWNPYQLKKWTIIWNIILWLDIVLYAISALLFRNSIGIGLGIFISLVYIFLVELLIYPSVKKIYKNKINKKGEERNTKK